ncbi:MAG TPA: hypothetical protein VFS52_20480 [Steroidobacteraceae bacterium]|jgi:hypothetical protein|nr:hypothetical protein [Steroidobacteraceae bacterium]
MNDVHVAAENNDEGMEARELVEFGEVSTETKGLIGAWLYDGNGGWWG